MIKKFFLVLIAFCCFSTVFSQTNLNDYKYVIVPSSFEFLKGADKYRLNTLTKFLLKKNNFQAYISSESLPDEVVENSCIALYANVLSDSGMFKTKLTVQLKDCRGNVIYTSNEGVSRNKEYAIAYNQALREAFNSFDGINYKYVPKESEAVSSDKTKSKEDKDEIKKLKAELKVLKAEKKDEIVNHKSEPKSDTISVITDKAALYAQAIPNGFQLVDSAPKVVFKIKNTSLNGVYLVEGRQAIIYKLNGNWVLEFYENKTLKTKTLNIKF